MSILVRIPFLKTFDLVSYDGTYYINQASAILNLAGQPGGFPVGYPVLIALFLPLVRDGVRAAQAVSLLAGCGSLVVFYFLCRQYVKSSHALIAGLVLALTPIFIRLTMMTLSESVYILWVLLGLLFFAKNRGFLSGLSLGMAAITRPEALGILGVLVILKLRRPKRLFLVLAGFIIVYSVNVAFQSIPANRLVLIPKTKLFGTSAEYWKMREAWIEFQGKKQIIDEVSEETAAPGILVDYLKRLPKEFVLLIRHVFPIIFALALYGMYRKPLFLLASFVPFFLFPPFTFRSEPRFILPYIPGLILYASIGLAGIRKRRISVSLYALVILSAAVGVFVNRDQLVQPVSDGFQWTKSVGRMFRDRIEPGDKIADRKPFFAFYSGGKYIEIPVAPYDVALNNLVERDVKYLVLHRNLIHSMRPQLRPLLYDKDVINGELRFSQVFFKPGVVSIFQKNMDSDMIDRTLLIPPFNGMIYGPCWSPGGDDIVYRTIEPSGKGGIYIVSSGGGRAQRIITEGGTEDPVTWAPDSKRIAFANKHKGNMDIYIYDSTGELVQITSYEGVDMSPSWSRDGREIIFCSDRSGQSEIWSKNIETGELTRISTGGGAGYPAISPDGKRIAWIRKGEGLYLYDRGTGAVTRARAPGKVYFTPAWSPDGGFIAVTAKDWGGTDIYLVTADGKRSVLLTKTLQSEGMPTWSPDGESIALVSKQDYIMKLLVLTGIKPYKDRLMNPVGTDTFRPLRQ